MAEQIAIPAEFRRQAAQRFKKLSQNKKKEKTDWPDGHLVGPDGRPVPFHVGQRLAWNSEKRIVAIISGTQAGKTSWSPWWLAREIEREGDKFSNLKKKGKIEDREGIGDFLVATATYDLYKLKLLPEFLRVFEDILQLGRWWAGDKIFELSDPLGKYWAQRSSDRMFGRVILRSADATGGLESATAKAAWLDEAGQDKFTVEAWRAVRRRLGISRGRILITTTLYNLGWLKQHIIDRAVDGGDSSVIVTEKGGEVEVTENEKADITLIQFDSIVNPTYDLSEYKEARETMPEDEFTMFYRGRAAKLRHLIYDCFDTGVHTCKRFEIPEGWKRWVGLDFGGTNTVGVFFAQDPSSGIYYGYRYYKGGKLTASEHVRELLNPEPVVPRAYGGSWGEDHWRREFGNAGLRVQKPPLNDVDLGITRVYGMLKEEKVVFFDDLEEILDEFGSYKRKRDSDGEVLDKIENKHAYHSLDAVRYVLSSLTERRSFMLSFGPAN